MALRSRIPTFGGRRNPMGTGAAAASTSGPGPLKASATQENDKLDSLSKKRGRPTVPTIPTHNSPNPKARKILRTSTQTIPITTPTLQKRARPLSPTESARKRVRVNTGDDVDPMDCIAGPAASQDSPPQPRARSATGFDISFGAEGSRLLNLERPDISSSGLYSDAEERRVGATQSTPTPRRGPSTRRKSGATPSTAKSRRQGSTTPRRRSTAITSPSTTPRQQQSTPRRYEPKTLPPPIVTPTAIQARKEARLAAAQAEAEARLRASVDTEDEGLSTVREEGEETLGGLSVVGEEEGEEERLQEGEEQEGGGDEWEGSGTERGQDLPQTITRTPGSTTTPVTSPSHATTPRASKSSNMTPDSIGTTTPRTTLPTNAGSMNSLSKVYMTRSATKTTPAGSTGKPTPHSRNALHVHWTSSPGVHSESPSEYEPPEEDLSGSEQDMDISRSRRNRSRVSIDGNASRRSTQGNKPRPSIGTQLSRLSINSTPAGSSSRRGVGKTPLMARKTLGGLEETPDLNRTTGEESEQESEVDDGEDGNISSRTRSRRNSLASISVSGAVKQMQGLHLDGEGAPVGITGPAEVSTTPKTDPPRGRESTIKRGRGRRRGSGSRGRYSDRSISGEGRSGRSTSRGGTSSRGSPAKRGRSRRSTSGIRREDEPTECSGGTPNKSPGRVEVVIPSRCPSTATGANSTRDGFDMEASSPISRAADATTLGNSTAEAESGAESGSTERHNSVTLQQPTPELSSLDQSPTTRQADGTDEIPETSLPGTPADIDQLSIADENSNMELASDALGNSASLLRSGHIQESSINKSRASDMISDYQSFSRLLEERSSHQSMYAENTPGVKKRFMPKKTPATASGLKILPEPRPTASSSRTAMSSMMVDGLATSQALRLHATTPRAPNMSTQTDLDFTPVSNFEHSSRSILDSKLGFNAQSTPFIRGPRPSLGLSAFDKLNLGAESSPAMFDATPDSEEDLDMNVDNAAGEETSPSQTRERPADGQTGFQPPEQVDETPEPQPDREISIVLDTSSPSRSLRTERVSTPRAPRISQVHESESDNDDEPLPPSPSAGRSSLSEGSNISGRKLSDILRVRAQEVRDRERSRRVQEDSGHLPRNPLLAPEDLTRLSDQARGVLQQPSDASERLSATSSRVRVSGRSNTSVSLGRQSEVRDSRSGSFSGASVSRHGQNVSQRSENPQVPRDYDASVQFDKPIHSARRRSGTPVFRGWAPSEHEESNDEDEREGMSSPQPEEFGDGRRSSGTSVHSSRLSEEPEGADGEEEESGDEEGSIYDENGDPMIKISGPPDALVQAKSALLKAGYVEDQERMERYSRARSIRSRSRSLSRPAAESSARNMSLANTTYGHFLGDRTTGLSRSQMMAEASRYEDWEPPSRRELRPRKWTEHDWRMLAHYMRRVQKSQALASGLSSRQELDLRMVDIPAVVDRFVEEEAHGIKLEGEWDKSEIAGRTEFLIMTEGYKKDGSWRDTLANITPFETSVDSTRRHEPDKTSDDGIDQPKSQILPPSLAGHAKPRQNATEPIQDTRNTPTETSQDGSYQEAEPSAEGSDAAAEASDEQSQDELPQEHTDFEVAISVSPERPRPSRETRRDVDNSASTTNSRFENSLRSHGVPPTPIARFFGTISSYISGRPQNDQASESSFPKLKPTSRNPIDLTAEDEEENRFPVLNHVPTPIRPTPARLNRQKRVEPRINIPLLHHVSPQRATNPVRPTGRIRRVASVKELARSFELMEEKSRQEAEIARRVGLGRRVVSEPSKPTRAAPVPAPVNKVPASRSPIRKSPVKKSPVKKAPIKKAPVKKASRKHEVEVITISDSSC